MIDGNRCSVFAAVLAVSFSAAAQDGGVPQTPIELPKPPPELEQHKPLEGSWSCKGTVPAGAMGPGSPEQSYRSTMKMKKSLDGFWYMTDYEEKKTKTHPVAVKAHGPLGFDPVARKFILLSVDSMGGYVTETSAGWEGDKLVITGDGVVMGQKSTLRDTVTLKGKNELVWASDLKTGGAADFTSMGEQRCKRREDRP